MIEVDVRLSSIARGAAEWRDPRSPVRAQAREALVGGPWSKEVVEAALDDVLWDLDVDAAIRAEARASRCRVAGEYLDDRPVLVVLPGNVIGPAVQSAYCAALTGSRAILKSSSVERSLAEIAARQFDRLGAPRVRSFLPAFCRSPL